MFPCLTFSTRLGSHVAAVTLHLESMLPGSSDMWGFGSFFLKISAIENCHPRVVSPVMHVCVRCADVRCAACGVFAALPPQTVPDEGQSAERSSVMHGKLSVLVCRSRYDRPLSLCLSRYCGVSIEGAGGGEGTPVTPHAPGGEEGLLSSVPVGGDGDKRFIYEVVILIASLSLGFDRSHTLHKRYHRRKV